MEKFSFETLKNLLHEKLIENGFNEESSDTLAEVYTENTFAGVASHGVNRFPLFIKYVKEGHVDPAAEPEMEESLGAWELWNGNFGAGILNAIKATDRAVDLAQKRSIGCVSLKNTNHWMRAGYYGWRAAEKNIVLIAWTNTIPIVPPWGGKQPRIGNNPIVIGVPRTEGHVVLDMATTQFSYGKLAEYKREGKKLPFPGGFTEDGELTRDASQIYASERPLPIGMWKGSGLTIMLDLLAAILSGGKATYDLGKQTADTGMSQIFIAFDPTRVNEKRGIDSVANHIIDFAKSSALAEESENILYPGERLKNIRERNRGELVSVHPEVMKMLKEI